MYVQFGLLLVPFCDMLYVLLLYFSLVQFVIVKSWREYGIVSYVDVFVVVVIVIDIVVNVLEHCFCFVLRFSFDQS